MFGFASFTLAWNAYDIKITQGVNVIEFYWEI